MQTWRWTTADLRSQTTNVHFAPIVLKKSAAQLFETAPEDRRAWTLACSGRHWGGERDQLGELSEVLGRCSEEELVLGPIWPSQPEPVEAQDALEMREQHLDLLTFRPLAQTPSRQISAVAAVVAVAVVAVAVATKSKQIRLER